MTARNRSLAALALAAALAAPAIAHEPPPTAAAPSAGTPSGWKAEYLAFHARAAQQLLDLAAAVPADKFAWRPAEGVRSYGEVCLHVAAADFALPGFLGVKPPEGVDPQKVESSPADKAAATATLKRSLDHVRDAVQAMTDADLDKKVELFGQSMSGRGVLTVLANHIHEHLGQSIAYARMNGIAPPWSK